jgi:carbon monoxide dehydrogenase subunit G
MKFENAFVVQAPIDDVYAALLDVERVAPCMPGAEVVEKTGDDAYKVAIKVKVGPMSMTYKGDVQIVERDEAAKTATLRAKAKESRGQGTADAHVHMTLAEEDDGTHAALETDVALGGRVAAMGRGVIGDVSARLVQTFAGNLAAMLEGGAGEPSPNGAATAAAPASDPAPRAEPSKAEPAEDEASLPVGDLVASVVAGRLADPKSLAAGASIFAMICLVIGYLVGRAR